MKKLMITFVLVLGASMMYGQACSKTCNKKNSYVKNGDVIEAILYHDNGAIAQTGTYNLDNELEGEWISYDTDGNKTALANYRNGQKVGTWLLYQGDKMKEVTYADAAIAEVKTYAIQDTRVVSNRP